MKAIDRQRAVLQAILEGATLAEAAAAAGYAGRQGAQQARDGALAELDAKVQNLADEYRAQAEQRLATALRAIWAQVKKGNLTAIDRYVRIENRWSKMRGGDAPVKASLQNPDGSPLLGANDALLAKLDDLANRFAPPGDPSADRRKPDPG